MLEAHGRPDVPAEQPLSGRHSVIHTAAKSTMHLLWVRLESRPTVVYPFI